MDKHIIEPFRDKLRQIHDGTDHPNQLLSVWSDARVTNLLHTDLQYLYIYSYPLVENFVSVPTYRLSVTHGSFIIAIDGNDLLWLDNHWDETDFERFLAHQQVLKHLNDDPQRLAILLTETKFAFMWEPKAIFTVADIPLYPEKRKEMLKQGISDSEWQAMEAFYKDEEQRRTALTSTIRPPQLTTQPDGAKVLKFYLWTHRAGLVFEMNCLFGLDGSFRYSSTRLEKQIGHFALLG